MTLPRSRPLARGKGLKRTGGPKRRTRIRRRGTRGEAERQALERFRREVLKRAKGRCERCGQRTPEWWLDAHHLQPRARGGTHQLTNGAALCRPCHRCVHDHSAADWRDWLCSGKPESGTPVASGDACPHHSLSLSPPLHRRSALGSQES